MPSHERLVERLADGRRTWVWEAPQDDGPAPVAFIDLQVKDDGLGYIDMLFCDPEFTRMRIAGRLYDGLEHFAQALGLARLQVDASELAAPVFQSRGFEICARQNVERNGVTLHNYRMEKRL